LLGVKQGAGVDETISMIEAISTNCCTGYSDQKQNTDKQCPVLEAWASAPTPQV